MRTLDRKLRRDLGRIRGQAAAIAAIVAAGMAVSVLGASNLETLTRSRASLYQQYRFADAFASVTRAPLAAAARLREIPGIAVVDARVVGQATLDMPAVADPIAVKLVGVPPRSRPSLNDLAIVSGRYIEAPDEVVVSMAFATARGVAPGATLTAVINEGRQRFRVAGIATSPEYVYALRPGTIFPDDQRYGVVWLDQRIVASAFDLDGAFNDVAFRLDPGARLSDVIARVNAVLAPYGGNAAYPRADQTSHWFLESELSELQTTGRILPLVFAVVAAFLLHIVVSRLVTMQREQIGVLRAFGYPARTIAAHYAKLVLLITAAGAAVGVPAGLWLGWYMSGIYQRFFHFPVLLFAVPAPDIALAILAAAAIAVGGSLAALRQATRITPAVALRPPAPARFRRSILERAGLYRRWSPAARMIARGLERRPLRAALAVLAVALALAIMILGRFGDSLEYVMHLEFTRAQRQSGTIVFTEPRPWKALREVGRFPGVLATEPFRSVPVRFVHGTRSRRGAVTGLLAAPQLSRPLDARRGALTLPAHGLLLSDKLARLLQVTPGDHLDVEVLEGRQPRVVMEVAGTVEDYLGTSAYVELSELNVLLGEGRMISGTHLLFGRADEAALFARVKQTPGVAAVTVMRTVRDEFRRTLAESLFIALAFLVVLAGVIAFGVVFNTARIILSERAWDLATLRVLGFTRHEVGIILLGEVGAIVGAALPVGLLLGRLLTGAVSAAYDTELYRLPPVTNPGSYLFALAVVGGAALLSGAVVWRLVGRLDLVSVLKARE